MLMAVRVVKLPKKIPPSKTLDKLAHKVAEACLGYGSWCYCEKGCGVNDPKDGEHTKNCDKMNRAVSRYFDQKEKEKRELAHKIANGLIKDAK